MMVIEVRDQNAPAGMGCEKIARRDRDVVEETEAHTAPGLGVMSGRPNQREYGTLLRNGGSRGRKRASSCPARNPERTRVNERIAGREIACARKPGGLSPDQFEVAGRVNPLDLAVRRVFGRQRVFDYAQRAQALDDRFDALGPLGMQNFAKMIPIEGIDHESQPECLEGAGLHESAAAFFTSV
jgi:hypothetical protein